jgi:outer membrane immunogenic protein
MGWEIRWARLALAVAMAVAFVPMTLAPAKAQSTDAPNPLLAQSQALIDAADRLSSQIRGYSCVDQKAYDLIKSQVTELRRKMKESLKEVQREIRFEELRQQAQFGGFRTGPLFDSEEISLLKSRARNLEGASIQLIAELHYLKICPPGTTYSIVGPNGAINPPRSVRGGMYERPGSWTGWNVGGGVGVNKTDGNYNNTQTTSKGGGDPNIDPDKDLAATNFAAEVYAGYFWDLGAPSWVAGLEADIAYFNALMDPGIPGTGAIGTAAVRANDNVTVRANWNFSLRGRLGYIVNPSTMVYLTAGPSWLNARTTVNCTAAGVCGTNGIPAFSQTNSSTLPGWTLGGGLEEKLFGNWRGRLEYRYSRYGTWSTNFGTPATLFVAPDIKLHTNTVTVGLVYSFGR